MNRQAVTSSNLRSVGYENGVLEIEFHSSGIYQYSNVSAPIYQGLMNASSKGGYFHQHIKDQYEYTQIA